MTQQTDTTNNDQAPAKKSLFDDANAAWERAKADGYVPACFYGTPAEDDAPWDCD